MRYQHYVARVLLALLLFTSSAIFGQQRVEDVIPADPEVRTGKLSNGLTYYIRKNQVPTDKVSLRLVVNAGSPHEDPDQLGLAHLLEHMAFNGTKHFPKGAIRDYFNSLGLQPGNDWNASTGDFTDYFMDIPSGNSQAFSNCLQILRDWAQDMQLNPDEIDAERGVVLGEFRSGSAPGFIAEMSLQQKLVYNNPKYMYPDPVTWRAAHDKNIKGFKHELLRRFYRDWYRPDLQAVIVVGNIDVAEVEQKIRQLFGDLKMPETVRDPLPLTAQMLVNLPGKRQYITVSSRDAAMVTFRFYQKRKASSPVVRTLKNVRNAMNDALYDEMVRQRLKMLMRNHPDLLSNTYHNRSRTAFGVNGGVEMLTTTIMVKPDQPLQPAVKQVMAEMNRIATDGFTETELQYAKPKVLQYQRELAVRYRSSYDMARLYQDHFLNSVATPAPGEMNSLYEKIIEETTVAEISAVAREWLNDMQNADIGIIAPEIGHVEVPSEKDMWKCVAEAKRVKLPAYKAPEQVTGSFLAGKQLPAAPGKVVEADRVDEELAFRTITFTNGMRLILKKSRPEKGKEDQVSLTGIKPGGVQAYAKKDSLNAANLGCFSVRQSGLGKYNKFQMEEFLSEKQLNISFLLGNLETEISGTCRPQDMETMLEIMYLQMTDVRKDPAAFEVWRQQERKEAAAYAVRNASYVFAMDSARNILHAGRDTRIYRQLNRPEIDQLNFDRMYEIYREQFASPAGFTMILTGQFDEAEAIRLMSKYCGGFAKEERRQLFATPGVIPIVRGLQKTFYFGTGSGADVQLHFSGTYQPGIRSELLLQYVRYALEMKIRERLREKEGGTYSATTGCMQGREWGDAYCYSIYFNCTPDNVEHMIDAAKDEITTLKKGIDEKFFLDTKQMVKEDWQKRLSRPDFWPAYLKDQYRYNEDNNVILRRLGLIDIITREDVNEALQQYLDVNTMTRLVLMPETSNPK